MPQETNLNVSPYFDDFDENKNYYKVLFKPGYPIQARELTTIQSILQNQIEQHGKNIFKEGSVVIPGQLRYESPLHAVELDSFYNGVPLSAYFSQLLGKRIQGSSSGVTAEIVYILSDLESERGSYTLYIKYLQSGGVDFTNKRFQDAETLVTLTPFTVNGLVFQSGQGFCNTKAVNSISEGSAATIADGVYYVRGFFANVNAQTILLDQYNPSPSYKVGFNIIEKIVTADEDESLFDNAQSFSNYSAPGADRFALELELSKRSLTDSDTQNFVEIFRVTGGVPEFFNKNIQYNLIRDEISKRTSDISGDFVVNPFSLSIRDSLNDKLLNRGLFFENELTTNGNVPSEDLMVYQIGSGKAYVNGYDVEIGSTRFVDVPKARTTATINDNLVSFDAGVLCIVNNAYGAPNIGLTTTSTVKLMDSRIGSNLYQKTGTEIGSARIYDFVPESEYIDATSRLQLRLFDIETYTTIGLTAEITLNTPAVIKGKRSKAIGYLKENASNTKSLKLYGGSGNFLENEPISINEIDNTRLITSVTDYSLSDVKSLYSEVGISTFNADVIFGKKSLLFSPGTEYKINSGTVSSGLDIKFTDKVKVGDIISYNNSTFTGDPIYNKVVSVAADGSTFSISGITTVTGVCDGKLASGSFNVTNIYKLDNEFLSQNSSLFTVLNRQNVSSVSILNSEIIQRKLFKSKTVQSNGTIVIDIDSLDVDIYFQSFDEDRYIITYPDGTIEKLRSDKFALSNNGKRVTFRGLSKTTGVADVITTVVNRAPSSKNKKLNKVSSLVVSNSKFTSSGIGTTTLNDGLTYSNVYGTRVQDEDICLNVPDVVRVLGIYESGGTSDPQIPNLQLTSFSGPSNNNSDYIIGEYVIGKSSGAVGIVISKQGTDKIDYVPLNSFSFQVGEVVEGKESRITSTIFERFIGDRNITQSYLFDDGQREHFYDYSRITRKSDVSEPTKKLKIIFQNYTIDSNDTGEFITANSFSSDDYKHNVPLFNNIRTSDFIDIRPRVAPYSLTTKSPFEFDSRNFALDGQYSEYILASGENINVTYSYYQGRIDLINLNNNGTFEVVQGIPSDRPLRPSKKANSLDIAYVFIPPYVFDTKNIKYDTIRHRRYTMSDISSLEDRIERVERYTVLSMLESKTENLIIKDAETGLDRFKCGFFVDNFSSHDFHDIENPYFNAAIDEITNTLRPRHYTTSIDLQYLPSNFTTLQSADGNVIVETTTSETSNLFSDSQNQIANAAKKHGDLITLNYNEILYFEQPYATKSENVTPFLVRFWQGLLDLRPSLDTWIEENDLGLVERINRTTTTETTRTVNGAFVGRNTVVDNPTSQAGILSDSFDWISNAKSWVSAGRVDLQNGSLNVTVGQNNENRLTVEVLKDRIDASRQNQVFSAINTLLPPDAASQFIDQVRSVSTNNRVVLNFQSPQTTATNINPTTTFVNAGGNTVSTTRSEAVTTVTNRVTVETESDTRFLRSRNIEFDAKGLKPLTKFYPIFEGINVENYVTPKLLEIEMVSGEFAVGETVESSPLFTTAKFRFRLCSPGHKSGTHNNPTESFKLIPYTQQAPPSTYGSSATFLNVDTNSLQLPSEVNYYGNAAVGMQVIGKTSGAVARVTNIRLISDNSGSLIGSLFIPNPSIQENPKWTSRRNTFILTDVPQNIFNLGSEVQGLLNINRESHAEATFANRGVLKTRQTIVTSTIDSRVTVNENTIIPPPPPPPQPPVTVFNPPTRFVDPQPQVWVNRDPLAQSFFVSSKYGLFLSSVDVYFETKDDEQPVILQIRPIISGVPSNIIIPYSEVTLTPDKVNVSVDSSIATRFTFPSLVYLNGARENGFQKSTIAPEQVSEYAVVLLSNSPNYRVFVSELGKTDLLQTNVRVSTQPTLGSLFKSQNGTTWNPSQLEDLKFKLYRADFSSQGVVRFVNPILSNKNGKVTVTGEDQFLTLSKKTVVGLGSTGYNSSITVPGIKLIQNSASGTLTGIAGSIKVGVGVTIINAGAGYTGAGTTFTNVNLITETGFGSGAIVNIDINSTTTGIGTVTVINGGSGYQIGDSLIIPEIGSGVGYGGKVSVISIGSSNSFVIDNVQGTFTSGSNELQYVNSSGITSSLGVGITISSVTEDQYYDGRHMKVYHTNHGMHSSENYVKISKFKPSINESNSKLTSDIDTAAINIPLTAGTGNAFTQFEGLNVSSSNIGYVIIGEEIIGYTSVSGDTLISSSELRGVDSTQIQSYTTGTQVYKYELEGVSLRRINKIHNLSLVNKETHPTDLNSYHIKIEMADVDYDGVGIGSDRSSDLSFRKTAQNGSTGTNITNNIQYEAITPSVGALVFPDTNIVAKLGSVTGTSVGGNENSFENAGYDEVELNSTHFFDSPRLVCSPINEFKFNTELPANKSLYLELVLTSDDSSVSPVIDSTQVSAILTSNLINNPIGVNNNEGYANDDSVRSLSKDKHSAVYLSKLVRLKLPANSLKVILAANMMSNNDVRVLFQTFRSDSPNNGDSFDLFPGYSNYEVDSLGIKRVIDYSKNDGSSDNNIVKNDSDLFNEYEYSVDNLADFDAFVIKIVMSSENQAKPPLIKDLRAIATLKPKV